MRRATPFVVLIALTIASAAVEPVPASAAGDWAWPVVGPLLRGFDPPTDPYGSGHRGIDIATPLRSTVAAPEAGVVSFAGPVGGRLFVTIDHGGGLESTYSWLDALLVRRGDVVTAGQPIARSGWGHATAAVPHLHMGVRLDDVYVDPLRYLRAPSVSGFIRLAPLGP